MPRLYVVTPPDARFWAKVEKTETCWLWRAAISDTGYGIFNAGKRRLVGAHRYSWEMSAGPLLPGECVLHKCDVRACVRPDHLFKGSQADNVADMDRKGRRVTKPVFGEEHNRSKLTAEDVKWARSVWKNKDHTGNSALGGLTVRQLAEHFNVSSSTMHSALLGKTWK